MVLPLKVPRGICWLRNDQVKLGGGGGVATQKKPNATANFKFGTGFFSGFFLVFFGFSILANFDWFNGFLLSGSFC